MDDIGLLGLLAVFLCPMVFGGITMYYSHKSIHKSTLDRWEKQIRGRNSDEV